VRTNLISNAASIPYAVAEGINFRKGSCYGLTGKVVATSCGVGACMVCIEGEIGGVILRV